MDKGGTHTSDPQGVARIYGPDTRLTTHATTAVNYHVKVRLPLRLAPALYRRVSSFLLPPPLPSLSLSLSLADARLLRGNQGGTAGEDHRQAPSAVQLLPRYVQGEESTGPLAVLQAHRLRLVPADEVRQDPDWRHLAASGHRPSAQLLHGLYGEGQISECGCTLTPIHSQQNSEEALRDARWIDGRKALFRITLRLDSTVLSDDLYLQSFLMNSQAHVDRSASPSAKTESIALGIRNLRTGDPLEIYRFLPVILNQLLYLIARPPPQAQAYVTEPQAGFTVCSVHTLGLNPPPLHQPKQTTPVTCGHFEPGPRSL